MKNKTVLIIAAFTVVAAIAAMIAGREALNAVLEDAIHWSITSLGRSGGGNA